MPNPYSALSSKRELAQAGPRPSAFTQYGRSRERAAVDRGAARGVGDDHPVAEELSGELDVGRFAASGAGAAEFEERLEELAALDRIRLVAVEDLIGEVLEELLLFRPRRPRAPLRSGSS